MGQKPFLYGILGLIILSFLGFGLLSPSYSYKIDIIVDKPRDITFANFRHYDFMGEWVHGFQKVEIVEGDGYSAGSVNKLHFSHRGQVKTAIERIVKHEDPDLIEVKIEYDQYTDDMVATFKEKHNHTRITAVHTISGNNIFWRSIYFFKKGGMITQSYQELETLKRLIEDGRLN